MMKLPTGEQILKKQIDILSALAVDLQEDLRLSTAEVERLKKTVGFNALRRNAKLEAQNDLLRIHSWELISYLRTDNAAYYEVPLKRIERFLNETEQTIKGEG